MVAFRTWEEPALHLSIELEESDDGLAGLANQLGLAVAPGERRLLVIARVQDEVARLTRVGPPRVPSRRQAELLTELGVAREERWTARTADALIRIGIFEQRLLALRSLRPARGERFVRTSDRRRDRLGEIVEVSSIDRFGQVWVKGAGGYPTRPQDLARI